jgi:hypothetical protein
MQKFELYVGCNVNGKPEYTTWYVMDACRQALEVMGFDGATFTEAMGLWEGVQEHTVICMICTDRDRGDVHALAGLIGEHLRQDSVMVVESDPRIDFIEEV